MNDEKDLETPWEDLIVAEVRAARAALWAAAGYDAMHFENLENSPWR